MSNKGKNIFLNILLVICVAVFLTSGYFLYKELSVYKKGKNEYTSWVASAVTVPEGKNPNDPLVRVINFQELQKTNKDAIGWIYIPNTVVDYPVVQGKDNDKYLDTLFSGEKNKAGAIFMDYRNTMPFADDNTIIYGHNMKNKTMFHILREYRNQSFYDANKTIYYYSQDSVYEMRIFSAYTVHASDPYTQISFGDKKAEKINQFVERSNIKSAYTIMPDSKIVTLSTCAYDYDDARFVVHATVHKMPYGGYK